jgi:hypothetical protein
MPSARTGSAIFRDFRLAPESRHLPRWLDPVGACEAATTRLAGMPNQKRTGKHCRGRAVRGYGVCRMRGPAVASRPANVTGIIGTAPARRMRFNQ